MKYLPLAMAVAMSLTACQTAPVASQTSATPLKNQPIEQQRITFDKPVLQQPVLQEEVGFDDVIKPHQLGEAKPVEKQSELQEALIKYHWRLLDAWDKNKNKITLLTENPQPVSLDFGKVAVKGKTEYNFGFSVGCNRAGGMYQLNKSMMTAPEVVSTSMFCQDLDRAERRLSGFMKGDNTISLNLDRKPKPILTQNTADGSTLEWQGTLTNEEKYGKGETIFLEIAPETEFCSGGMSSPFFKGELEGVLENQCLKVRDVYYNDNWIKSGYSDWRLMKNPIEGYRHDANYRKLLRVKKYITDPVDIKGKQLTYVLDRVVETEVVN